MKRVLREILTHESIIIMANWGEAEIPEGNSPPALGGCLAIKKQIINR